MPSPQPCSGTDALYEDPDPFLVICDSNIPKLNGFELRKQIFEESALNERCTPYSLLATVGASSDFIKQAYKLSVQGFFTKPADYKDYERLASQY